jgi:Tfp pilus assembly protein FimV
MRPPVAAPIGAAGTTPQAVEVAGSTAAAQAGEPASTLLQAVEQGRRAARGDRVHVVLAGESLWSIARDIVGGDASVAAVAREVNRLWELNTARIGTGDPDLLIAGTRLLLR